VRRAAEDFRIALRSEFAAAHVKPRTLSNGDTLYASYNDQLGMAAARVVSKNGGVTRVAITE
jgi:hypothetical protein